MIDLNFECLPKVTSFLWKKNFQGKHILGFLKSFAFMKLKLLISIYFFDIIL